MSGSPVSHGIVYRREKGSALTADEADDNLLLLDTRLTELETHPIPGVGIEAITVAGNSMTIILSDGTTQGPFALPVARIAFQGAWLPEQFYIQGDVVNVGSQYFQVQIDHLSPATFDPGHQVGSVSAYALMFDLGVDIVRTLDLQISEASLLANKPQWLVAPVSGHLVGIDAIVQSDLQFGGTIEVEVNGDLVPAFTLHFPAASAGTIRSAEIGVVLRAIAKGDAIAVRLVNFGLSGDVSGFSPGEISGFSGALGEINVSLRYTS